MKNRNLEHKDDWATPKWFYDELDAEFGFLFDPCPINHDLSEWDGLEVEWKQKNFVNPPYSQKLKEAFIGKAIKESMDGKLCVMLLPVSTSTVVFHRDILPNATDIRFVKGRLAFIGTNAKGQIVNSPNPTKETILFEGEEINLHVKNSGMHDSMIVIFDGRC